LSCDIIRRGHLYVLCFSIFIAHIDAKGRPLFSTAVFIFGIEFIKGYSVIKIIAGNCQIFVGILNMIWIGLGMLESGAFNGGVIMNDLLVELLAVEVLIGMMHEIKMFLIL
jgi:hypothetical protein